MKLKNFALAAATIFFAFSTPLFSAEPDPVKLLEKMDFVLRGSSHDMTVTLNVKTARWQRDYKINVRMKGLDYAFARVLEPAKVAGQGFLRIEGRLWQYLPTAERTILIPPSLMLDNFMGSDFSNDDFVKMSYMARDYRVEEIKPADWEGKAAHYLRLIPNPDAPVTYGQMEVWLLPDSGIPLRWSFYNEKMVHIRTLDFDDIRDFDGHSVPTRWHMKNHRETDRETVVNIISAQFGSDIPDSEFTRQKLEKYP